MTDTTRSSPRNAAAAATAKVLTPRGERTRAALIAAARQVFEEKGYLDTNIQDISAQAGVAYGTFYTYFPSKEEIFHEVVTELIAGVQAAEAQEPRVPEDDPALQIARANRGFFHAYRENYKMFLLLEQVTTINPQLAEIHREARRPWLLRNERAIKRWQRAGLVRKDIDPFYAASALGSMVSRAAYMLYVVGEEFDEEVLIDQLDRLYCGALGIDPPRSRRGRRH